MKQKLNKNKWKGKLVILSLLLLSVLSVMSCSARTSIIDAETTNTNNVDPTDPVDPVDTTAPINQDAVLPANAAMLANSNVTITSSGDETNEVWLAPAGTTSFAESSTMTKAASGTATSITAPADDGDYYIYVIDSAGNISVASTAKITVIQQTKYNPEFTNGEAISGYIISPDSTTVVYWVSHSSGMMTYDNIALYSIPIGGGSSTVLNDTWQGTSGINEVKITSDSTRVIYKGDQDTDGKDELYSVAIGGGTSTKINTATGSGTGVSEFEISDDSRYVVYSFKEESITELYSVPVAGGVSIKLSGTLTSWGIDQVFFISPDSTKVVYCSAFQDNADIRDIYSNSITGGSIVNLSSLSGDQDAKILTYGSRESHISPDSATVLFTADIDTDNIFDLYSVAITGVDGITKLNTSALQGKVYRHKISPNSSSVAFIGDTATQYKYDLFTVPIGGGVNIKINDALVSGGSLDDFLFSPDSSKLVFFGDLDTDGVVELYSSPVSGGGMIKLNSAMPVGGNVFSSLIGIKIFADNSTVTFIADMTTDGTNELYSVAITGGTITTLNDTLVSGGNVSYFYGLSGDTIFYIADHDIDGVNELYKVAITGGTSTKLSGTLVSGGSVNNFKISSDGKFSVFGADKETDDVWELFGKSN